jgi:NADH-quinone oxidoreductase subunit J
LNAGTEERTKGGSYVAMIIGIPGLVLGSGMLAWVLVARSATDSVPAGALSGSPRELAPLLFHEFLLPFEVTSILVLIAIMGAVVLASHPNADQKKENA